MVFIVRVFVCFSSRSAHRRAIGFSTLTPKPMQTKVAIVYPKIPESMLGMKYARHPLATHMAAAVVGPPTFALLASTISFLEYPNSFPAASTMPRWTKTLRQRGGCQQRSEGRHWRRGAYLQNGRAGTKSLTSVSAVGSTSVGPGIMLTCII